MLIDLTIPNINTTNLMQANFTSYNEFQTGKLHDSNSDAQEDSKCVPGIKQYKDTKTIHWSLLSGTKQNLEQALGCSIN